MSGRVIRHEKHRIFDTPPVFIMADKFLSVTEISRKLDVPRAMISKAIVDGRLVPDANSAKSFLFREERLPDVADTLRALYQERLDKIVSAILAASPEQIRSFNARHQLAMEKKI